MVRAQFIVCEQTSCWAVAFRRHLRSVGISVGEVRSLDECDRQMIAVPRTLLAIEMTRHTAVRRSAWLHRATRRFPHARALVVADRGMETVDWVFREAGAIYVQYSRRNVAPAARLVRQYVGAPDSEASQFRKELWSRLPLEIRPMDAGSTIGS